tara:strand:+ start:64 stop:594 length:531 start_codon:yes stop_codon:yes gene_type:complete
MKYKYKYISDRTKEDLVLSKLPTKHILQSYNMIKKKKTKGEKRWGIFLFDEEKNEIIGVCEVISQKEDGVKVLLIVYTFIDENYRGNRLCYELVKKTILKNEEKKGTLIKVVIAGGEPILKCLIKVFKELKYKVKKYKSDEEEDIHKLKTITFEDAIKIEKKNKKTDCWQTLFFTL